MPRRASKKGVSTQPGRHSYSRSMGPVGGRRHVGHEGRMTHRKYGRRGGK